MLVLAQKRGDPQLRPALAATWPQLLHGYLPFFVAVDKHMNRLFLLLVTYFMFLSLPSSSGSAEYSK